VIISPFKNGVNAVRYAAAADGFSGHMSGFKTAFLPLRYNGGKSKSASKKKTRQKS